MNHFFRLIFSLSFAAFMVASAGQSSNAAPAARQQSANFDGLWSVAIVTLQGPCDRSYRYPARVAGSRVMQANADPGYRLRCCKPQRSDPRDRRPWQSMGGWSRSADRWSRCGKLDEFGRPMRWPVDRRPARLTTLLGNLRAGD
jgi:hypothetical protein